MIGEINHNKVENLLREAAAEEIMPRWKNLRDHEVEQKAQNDVVTAADHGCEKFLAARLPDVLPGSVVIGEESVHANPDLVHILRTDMPVWVVDPLDGTRNFVAGKPTFAIMLCLMHEGETRGAWIYQPVADVLVSAESASGCYLGDKRLQISDAMLPLDEMEGALLTGFLPDDLRPAAESGAASLKATHRSFCAGHDYTAMVMGQLQFLFYYRTLIWDHAPGALMVQEAGGIAAHFDGLPYRPVDERKGLLCTSNRENWMQLQQLLVPSVKLVNA
ncbi:MAG: inositol monophosphatase [Gammaproteobacteria bacterium]|nr:inositol monophosphatase [Gammaproteobacteria bacterium]